MNKHYIASLLDETLQTVGCRFKGGNQIYTYKHRLGELKEGDELVVQTPSNGPQVVTVARVDTVPDLDADSSIEYAWVIQKVDRTAYDADLVRDKELFRQVKDYERANHRQQAKAALLATAPGLLAALAPPAQPVTLSDRAQIWAQGYAAAGQPFKVENPYPVATHKMEHDAWSRGYKAAVEDTAL